MFFAGMDNIIECLLRWVRPRHRRGPGFNPTWPRQLDDGSLNGGRNQ